MQSKIAAWAAILFRLDIPQTGARCLFGSLGASHNLLSCLFGRRFRYHSFPPQSTWYNRPVPKSLADIAADLEGYRTEIVGGQLIVQPPPAVRHNRAANRLWYALLGPYHDGGGGGPGGWVLLLEPGVSIPTDLRAASEPEYVVPDIAGWRRERMAEEPDVTLIEITPDWICEVLSSNSRYDRETKLPLYARMGVGHVWLIDPRELTLEVFELVGRTYDLQLIARAADVVRAVPFDALELDLSSLWIKPARP